MPDISSYAARIHDEEDRPLFDDAVQASAAGALRGAYVMIWLSCAESIKRRFREAEKRDGEAGKIVGNIDKKEQDHKSVDKYLLDIAQQYGLITDTAHGILLNIYEMRCVYGHPYEQAPAAEQVMHAAAMVVAHLLAQPVRLRHSYGETLLKNLVEDKNFLDDQASVVEAFVSETLPKIDERIFGWLLERYWKETEKIAEDATQKVFYRRGAYFTRAFLTIAGRVFTEDEWHAKIQAYPKTLARVFKRKPLFDLIGKRAQDSLVGSILDQAEERSGVLPTLEQLMDGGALSKRQKFRFLEHIDEMSLARLAKSKLSTAVCFKRLIAELKSRNWYSQSPAVEIVVGNGPADVKKLAQADQVTLGRNILQVADGAERSAKKMLINLADTAKLWPKAFIRGILLECFVNEEDEVRAKCDRLKPVLKAVDGLEDAVRNSIVQKVVTAIGKGIPKDAYLDRSEFHKICSELGEYPWAVPLKDALTARKAEMVIEPAPIADDDVDGDA